MIDKEKVTDCAIKVLNDLINFMPNAVETTLTLGFNNNTDSEETNLRLTFECLCFSLFLCCVMSSVVLTKRKWLRKHPNNELITLFHEVIESNITEVCKRLGATKLREIEITKITQIDGNYKTSFKLGDNLDPIKRMDEYRLDLIEFPGREINRFAVNIGLAIDAPNHTEHKVVGRTQAELLLATSRDFMEHRFNKRINTVRG